MHRVAADDDARMIHTVLYPLIQKQQQELMRQHMDAQRHASGEES